MKTAITTYEGWERVERGGHTGSDKRGDARWFKYDSALPSAVVVAKFKTAFGELEGIRYLKDIIGKVRDANRTNPLAKAPKTIKADVALARQLELAQQYIANGEDPMVALKRAANEALKVEPRVIVDWATKKEADDLNDAFKELAQERLGAAFDLPEVGGD